MTQPESDNKIIDLQAYRARRTRRATPVARQYVLYYPGVGYLVRDPASTGQALASYFGYRQPRV